jgi:hypothetical protein
LVVNYELRILGVANCFDWCAGRLSSGVETSREWNQLRITNDQLRMLAATGAIMHEELRIVNYELRLPTEALA